MRSYALGMGTARHRQALNGWKFWPRIAAAIPVGLAVTWVVRNFSPVAPDALAIPVACVVIFAVAGGFPRRKPANKAAEMRRSAPVEL
ncbi:glucose dehydrogenase [Arthrobacter sp. ES3-54]|jgi:hypothetical protein|nr:glucose dehydrogenase [Arthrobacter sp. ES3-54]